MAVLDFIINYDIKYRMGSDAEGEGSWLRVSLTPPMKYWGRSTLIRRDSGS